MNEIVPGNSKRYHRKSAADYLGISIVTLDRALAQKKISHFRIGRRVVFDQRHLDDFLAQNEKLAATRGRR